MAKRALLVGLNRYPDPADGLSGCVNDVLAMSDLLQRGYGFVASRDIRLLTDQRATTGRIIDRLGWLVRGSSAGDTLVFHFSGHGSQVRDRNGDELDDGLDEIICPYDLDWDHPFTDDDLGDALGPVAEGAHLVVVLDCCHSGTGLREPRAPFAPDRWRCLPPPIDIQHRAWPEADLRMAPFREASAPGAKRPVPRRFGASVAERGAVLLAGCRADQSAADAWIDGRFHGAFTYFLCRTLEESGFAASYGRLIAEVRRRLRRQRFDQVPQLECPPSMTGGPAFAHGRDR